MSLLRSFGCLMLFLKFVLVQAQTFEIDPSIFEEAVSGARSAGMGRAFVALANDGTALAWNPAGIAMMRQNSVHLSGTFTFGTLSIEPPLGVQTSKLYDVSQGSNLGLNYIGFTIPLLKEPFAVVSSVAIRNLVNLRDKITWSTVDEKQNIQQDIINDRQGGLFSLSGGMGARVLPNLTVGAALNFLTGRQDYKSTTIIQIREDNSQDWLNWTNNFTGFNFELGFIYHPTSLISLGSRVTFPFKLNYTNINYQDSNDRRRNYDLETFIEMPTSVRYGMAFHLSKDFAFAVDYVSRPWKKSQVYLNNTYSDRIFNNANSFHMGVEYLTKGSSFTIPLRVGFFTQPEQIHDFNSDDPFRHGDQVVSHSLTGGIGLLTTSFHYQVSMQYQMSQYKLDYLGIGKNPYDLKKDKFFILFGIEYLL